MALTGRDPAAPALDAGAGLADGLPRARPGLAYLVRSWPRLSQTFVLDEVLSLERLGFPVRVFALADPREPVRQPDLARVRAPVSYLDGAGALADHVRAALAAPGRYARAVWFVARHPESDRGYHGASRVRCLTFAVRLARLLGRDGASAHLHAHFAHDPALVALLTHRLVGIPWSFAAHARDLYQVPETALAERVASAAAAVTCCRAGAERLAAAVPERLRDRVRLIHHGVDVEAFRPGRAGAGQGHGPPLVVSVGRLVEKKGFPDLLDACRRLRDGGHAFRCVIRGPAPPPRRRRPAHRRRALRRPRGRGPARRPVRRRAREDPMTDLDRWLEQALNPRRARAALEAALGGRPGPRSFAILDAKYEAGGTSTVLYGLGDRLVTGATAAPGTGGGVHGDAAAGPQAEGLPVEPLGLRAWVFPHDPAMPNLASLLDPEAMAAALGAALPARRDGDRVVRCRVTPLRYRPLRRCTLRIEAWIRTPEGLIMQRKLFAKVYHDADKAASVWQEMRLLADAGPVRAGRLRVAVASAFLPEMPMVVQEPVTGTPLDGLIGPLEGPATSPEPRGVDGVLAAAAALAELHTAGLSTLVEGGPVALLDFDHCGMADPASDVGGFTASLTQLDLWQRRKARGSAASVRRSRWLAELGEAFVDAYERHGGPGPGLHERLAWHEAAALVRKALRAFARSPRSCMPGALVGAAQERLAGAAAP